MTCDVNVSPSSAPPAAVPLWVAPLCALFASFVRGVTGLGDGIVFQTVWSIGAVLGLFPLQECRVLQQSVLLSGIMQCVTIPLQLYQARAQIPKIIGYAAPMMLCGSAFVGLGATLLLSGDTANIRLVVGSVFLIFSTTQLGARAASVLRARHAVPSSALDATKGGGTASDGIKRMAEIAADEIDATVIAAGVAAAIVHPLPDDSAQRQTTAPPQPDGYSTESAPSPTLQDENVAPGGRRIRVMQLQHSESAANVAAISAKAPGTCEESVARENIDVDEEEEDSRLLSAPSAISAPTTVSATTPVVQAGLTLHSSLSADAQPTPSVTAAALQVQPDTARTLAQSSPFENVSSCLPAAWYPPLSPSYSPPAMLLMLLPASCAGGLLGGLMGVGGPPLMAVYSLLALDKETLRGFGIEPSFFMVIRMALYTTAQGSVFRPQEEWPAYVAVAAAALVGALLGTKARTFVQSETIMAGVLALVFLGSGLMMDAFRTPLVGALFAAILGAGAFSFSVMWASQRAWASVRSLAACACCCAQRSMAAVVR